MNFTLQEYSTRLENVKKRMSDRGLDLLILTDPSNMNYLTGYDGWSFYVPQGVIVSLDKEEPMWFGRKQDSNGARITTYLKDENILGILMIILLTAFMKINGLTKVLVSKWIVTITPQKIMIDW